MSGHSHYATTKRQKELKDNARGQVFSKLSRAITIAAKGGADPDANFKLRIAIEKAREASMPKENIDRAISKASSGGELEEVLYEGFAPGGAAVLVEVATDNRNRTNAEIKNLFEKNGGKMGNPGSVSFNFAPKGLLVIKKTASDDDLLKLIDLGAEDFEDVGEELEIYVEPNKLNEMQKKLTENSFQVTSAELMQKPINFSDVTPDKSAQVTQFLENFDNHDDVQKVFTNANF
ncbi:MAG TPA: YebC/PmpR family DNA-binding transcriptional regulator [Patescibacteria group bacterium]|nr:YebC/PmpR family DNA-binding transcriptional regulator [Patescibacteria group bacterium]